MSDIARKYAEWCELSGLYLANLSQADRYKSYAKVLSPAGLTVAVVSEFLDDANPALDVNDWRTHRVHEIGADQIERVERTVSTLREIGAERLAQAVAASRSNSPFDAIQRMLAGGEVPDLANLAKSVNPLDLLGGLQKSLGKLLPGGGDQQAPDEGSTSLDTPRQKTEDRKQVEELLERFAQSHREELQADMDRHGDPRLEPGFTRERRQQELGALRDRWVSHRNQADAIEALTEVMKKLPKITSQKTAGKEKKADQQIQQLVRRYREKTKELRKVAEADRSKEHVAFLPKLAAFETEWADLLRPDVIGDAQLRRTAEGIGEFSAESKGKSTTLEWDSSESLKCDWTTFRLTVDVPAKSKPAMQAGLQAVERLRQQFPALQEDWRGQTLASFREIYQEQMGEEELEDYDLDDEGEPTDAGILRHVESGSLVLSTADPEGRSFSLSAYLAVEWDQEHGFELECDVDLNDEVAGSESVFTIGDITLTDLGSKLTDEGLQRFESTFKITLPGDYREFLLQFNGGVPSKPYLVHTRDGMQDNWHVVRFLSMSGTTTAPFPFDSLEGRLHRQDGSLLSSHLLPIARIRKGSFDPLNRSAVLAVILSGKKAGKVAVFDAEMMLEPLLGTGDSLEMALDELVRHPLVMAAGFSSLWSKLLPAPEIAAPNWLRAIRDNNVDAFLAWAAGGGKTSERLIEPGADFQPTVVDLLAAEASDELLGAVVQQKIVRPKALRESWRQFLFLDVPRFRRLMPHLAKDQWYHVLASPYVWDHPDLLEELIAAGVNLEAAIDDEGGTALHHAVQLGRKDAVRWLLEHGADPKKSDRYGRNALIYAESGPGQSCLALLEGRPEPAPTGQAAPDAPGVTVLSEATAALAPGLTLRLQIEMTSPPVTRIEKVYYAEVGCHYRLTFEVNNGQVTFNDTRSPRQDYLHGKSWVEALFAPIVQWPELTPLWETLAVQEFDLKKAIKSRQYDPTPRPDLLPAARSALEQAFDPREAAARGVCPSHR
jgi:hypothetical protein